MSEITEEIRKELEEYDALMQKHPEWKGMHGKFPDWLRTLLEENERLTKLGSEAVREQEYAKGQAVKWNDEAVRLREELAEEKRHAALGWEQSNKWLEENGRLRDELDQLKREKDENESIAKHKLKIKQAAVDEAMSEAYQLRTELAEKDKVLEWIRDAGTDYQSINKARSILSQYKKGDTKYD